MIFITTNKNSQTEYFKDVLENYKAFVFTNCPMKKEVKFYSDIKQGVILFKKQEYAKALNIFVDTYNNIVNNRYIVGKDMLASLANNIANCYVKLQDLQQYKNYTFLEQAEMYYKKALKYGANLKMIKGVIYYNYGIFILKLQTWVDDPLNVELAKNNSMMASKYNQFTYTRKKSALVYKLFILSRQYHFYNDISDKLMINLGIRLF